MLVFETACSSFVLASRCSVASEAPENADSEMPTIASSMYLFIAQPPDAVDADFLYRTNPASAHPRHSFYRNRSVRVRPPCGRAAACIPVFKFSENYLQTAPAPVVKVPARESHPFSAVEGEIR